MPKEITIKMADKPIECVKDESLMLFDYTYQNNKKCRLFYGMGIVYRVVKGEKQDLIYINFGLFPTHPRRLVVAIDNHCRRQIMTLKRGQVCQVYGVCRNYKVNCEINGVKMQGNRLCLLAKGINGWYVPTSFDIKKMPVNEDLDEPTKGEEKLFDTFEDVLSQFLDGKEDDEL